MGAGRRTLPSFVARSFHKPVLYARFACALARNFFCTQGHRSPGLADLPYKIAVIHSFGFCIQNHTSPDRADLLYKIFNPGANTRALRMHGFAHKTAQPSRRISRGWLQKTYGDVAPARAISMKKRLAGQLQLRSFLGNAAELSRSAPEFWPEDIGCRALPGSGKNPGGIFLKMYLLRGQK